MLAFIRTLFGGVSSGWQAKRWLVMVVTLAKLAPAFVCLLGILEMLVVTWQFFGGGCSALVNT